MPTKIFNGLILKRKKMRPSNLTSRNGFTMIEIMIAVMILAGSLVVILGLEASLTRQALRTKNKQIAMLLARRVLAGIEASENVPEDQDVTEPMPKLLDKFAGVSLTEKSESKQAELQNQETYIGHLLVATTPIQGLEENAVKRITLNVSWSDQPSDSIVIDYFIPNELPDADEAAGADTE